MKAEQGIQDLEEQSINMSMGGFMTQIETEEEASESSSKQSNLSNESKGVKRQEWGISTVIINKRGDNPCPKCLPFVGKVMSDDV